MTTPFDSTQLQGLLLLAQDKRPDARAHLATRMGDMILGTDLGAMSARERELAEEILQRLLHQLEMPIRRSLAERLAQEDVAPRNLIVQLANDRIEVAWPVLLHSGLLDDNELLSVIRSRTMQHRLAIARREKISEPVSDALVRPGEQDVVRAVLENRGAAIAVGTFETLVENSQADSDLQEILLKRDDLDPRLAGRMYGWVSAALRHYIVENFEIDHFVLDKAISEALADVVADQRRAAAINGTLQRIRFAVDRNEVQDLKMLFPLIRAGERSLFEALFAKLTGISVATARRCLYETGGRALAVACRGCQIDKALFTEFFIALRQLGEESGTKVDPGELFEALSFYDRIDQATAEARVAAWRRGETRGALVEEIPAAETSPRPSAAEGPTRKMYAVPERRKTPFSRMH
ncbi:MAG: DUF2336 domain-containing protein [Magnetospirillum sp.]|jgi:uncharacterized protein (DUF2336 family)|nr:DUF2336 domain-containing protein [Magnetospirillum sp.]